MSDLRLAELLVGLSSVSDLGMGLPLGDVTRAALPATRFAATLRSQGARGVATAVLQQRQMTDGYTAANCEVASMMARRLRLPDGVQRSLLHIYAWWNGKGRPRGLAGDDIALASRVAQLATVAVLFDRLGEGSSRPPATERRGPASPGRPG